MAQFHWLMPETSVDGSTIVFCRHLLMVNFSVHHTQIYNDAISLADTVN